VAVFGDRFSVIGFGWSVLGWIAIGIGDRGEWQVAR